MITCDAIVLAALHQLPNVEKVVVHDPGDYEVRVKMVASGICHTDIGYMTYARTTPILLGHEGAGIVEKIGAHVRHVQVGDHVVINWLAKCGECLRCRSGHADWCEKPLSTAEPRLFWRDQPLTPMSNAGTFCEYAVVPAKGAIPIRKDIPLQTVATLGCAVATGVGAAIHTANVQPYETVVVIGAGGVGLNVIQGARLRLVQRIIAVDIDDERLLLARKFGATETVNSNQQPLVEAVFALTNGRGADHVFEVVGRPEVMAQGLQVLTRGGAMTLIGAADREAVLSFKLRRFMAEQHRLLGSVYGNVFPEVDFPLYADWYKQGNLLLDELHTETVSLADVPSVFAREKQTGVRTIVKF